MGGDLSKEGKINFLQASNKNFFNAKSVYLLRLRIAL